MKRRAVLALGATALAWPAFGQTRPRPRPNRAGDAGGAVGALINAAKLGGAVGYAVADTATGQLLAGFGADQAMPPASVTKAVTALYAIDRLGAQHRFTTKVMATGPVQNGVLQGDLILAGGGDPSLDTDRLGDMAAALAQGGLRRITGRLLIWAGALPPIAQIDADQPDYVGYNATISGVMLNYNRAQFVWRAQGGTLALGVNAEGKRFNPEVRVIDVQTAQREAPLFTYEARTPRERWSVAAPALTKSGSRWLPVRAPAAYIGDVFATLCAAHGIDLPAATETPSLPQGAQVLVQDRSEPLENLLRGMLRYSTNLTAESLGLAASQAQDLASSASAMSQWAAARFGIAARFVDHSGLGAASYCTPQDMLRVMRGAQQQGSKLNALLREQRITAEGREAKDGPLRILAKSGTLNFTSNLAGYVTTPSGRSLTFAIFAADSPRRAALPMAQREDPPGGAAWTKRARDMQRKLIALWAKTWP